MPGVSLLDVNVLLALAWPQHMSHRAARRWFATNHEAGWASCPVTQLGFVRLSMQPAVVKTPIMFSDVSAALDQIKLSASHQFWPMTSGLSDIHAEIRSNVVGHQQITDAALLDLAIRNNGRLATFDRRVAALLRPESPLSDAVALIPE